MTTNTLEFYNDVFSKDTKNFLQLISHITPHLAERDLAIAKFLGYQTPEILWLVRKLNFEYDKIFPDKIELPKDFIEQLARS
ncbi:15892_t:CDS:1, partial [Funneliformis geosporum]